MKLELFVRLHSLIEPYQTKMFMKRSRPRQRGRIFATPGVELYVNRTLYQVKLWFFNH